MHSVEQCDLAASARTHANPVSTRVCTPRYYDTQQAGVYSTPSKNTLGARRRARIGVLGAAGGRLRRSCVFEKSRGFLRRRATPLAAWPRRRARFRPCRGTNPLGAANAVAYDRPGRDPANNRAVVVRTVTPSSPRARAREGRADTADCRGLAVPHAAMRNFSAAIGRRILFARYQADNEEHED